MFFNDAFLNEIKRRIPLSRVVSKSVAIKKRKDQEYLALCPFHNEKTPSFNINDHKGFYHCFGCGEHGDIFTFLMEKQGFDFIEAVKNLAEEAGLPLPKNSPQEVQKYKEITDLIDVNKLTQDFFENNLYRSENASVLQYLTQRGLSKETIQKFHLGFFPDKRGALLEFFAQKNISLSIAEKCGLILKNDSGSYYERFLSRVIFPIFDNKNKPIAFGGRIFPPHIKDTAKYINSPETDIFKKAENLYLLNFARSEAYKEQKVFVVEGYMDAIMLHQAGITNTVATMGTAINENHILSLWQICNEVILALDGDEAGLRAMNKVSINFLPILKSGYSLKFLILPKDKDPADVIKENGGEFFKEIALKALSISEVLWQNLVLTKKNNLPEEIARIESEGFLLLNNIKDAVLQKNIRDFFKQKIWELKGENYNKKSKKIEAKAKPQLTIEQMDEVDRLENLILFWIIENKELIEEKTINKIEAVSFKNEKISNFFFEIAQILKEKNKENLSALLENIGIYDYMKSEFFHHLIQKNIKKDLLLLENKSLYLDFLLEKLKLECLKLEFEGSLNNFSTEEDGFELNKFELNNFERQFELNNQILEQKRILQKITQEIYN